jgi:hypothetical protein
MGSKCSSDKQDPIALTNTIKAFGAFSILLSIVEFGVGGTAFTFFTNVKSGAWWGAIMSFISGVFAIVATNKSVVISVLVLSIIAVIVAAVGAGR